MTSTRTPKRKGDRAAEPPASPPHASPPHAAPSPAARRSWLRPIAKWSAVALVWLTVAAAATVGWYAYDLPDVDALETPVRRPSVTVVSRSGERIATYGDLFAGPVAFSDLPASLLQAIVATEDRRFFVHHGVDLAGIARAALTNLRAGAIRQGGSTITQQLAKNLFLSPERSLRRKVQEVLLAIWLESRFTKEQLFAIYVNRVYLGAGTYGVAAAARTYFGRSVQALNLHESAMIAGLLKAPSRYAPTRDPAAARRRAAEVLDNMVEAGFLGDAEAAAAARQPLHLVRAAGTGARYFADWVMEGAASYVGQGGRDLEVVVTLDPKLQAAAEQAIRRALDSDAKAPGQAALVAMTPDGAIRAMVGGRDYGDSPFNRATQAERQPGSAFKLFVYLAALEAGQRPDDVFVDGPISIGKWRPSNYDNRFHGRVTMAEALTMSLNTVAVQASERAGRARVIDAARRLGITSPIESVPAMALGTSEVSLLELTGAYGALAAGGRAVWPHGIVEIRQAGGAVLYRRSSGAGQQVIDPRNVHDLSRMLSEVISGGTGRAARVDRPAAGKTGTTQDSRDGWFIGYTADLVAGVWMGNDDGSAVAGLSGGGLPARSWRDFMMTAGRGVKPKPLAVPRAPPARLATQDPDSNYWPPTDLGD